MMNTEKRLTLLGHLIELRRCLIRSVIAVAITTIFTFIAYRQIFDILIHPTYGINLIFIEMTEMLSTIMVVCLAGGIILAMPYLTYELIIFVSPALTRKEKKYVYLILPWIVLMFAGGIAFAYFILIPPATKFLITFGSDIATPQIKIGNYISIVTRLLLAVGLVFEMPVLTTFMARLGIITPKWLADKRRVAIVFVFILAAIITPTFDPINQTLVAAPLVVLYEISIWLAKLVYRKGGAQAVTSVSSTAS
ncbi:twin-arginine translocase subunit TatC [Chloroflexota bacterium]